MAGFVRRYLETPPVEVILQIEGAVVVDSTPPSALVGSGSGALLTFGEFEDGLFATENAGTQEVFSPDDMTNKYGGFGYKYGDVVSNNPCARRHLGELWNGNGFLKLYKVVSQRRFIARVDTSVGAVAISPQASILSGIGPFVLAVGQQLSITTDVGGPASSTAIAAVKATKAGAAGTFPTVFVGGETIGIEVDGAPEVRVVFSAADQSNAQVVAKINATLGYTAAVVNAGQVDISGIILGTAGRLKLNTVTPGVLATLGHTAGTASGTGNVANVLGVTAAEVAAIVNATAALIAVSALAIVTPEGAVRLSSGTASAGTINITSTPMALAMGITVLGVTVLATGHLGGSIPAGTRVRNVGAVEWVTMQTLDIPAADPGPWTVKVRHALDDGTGIAALAATVNLLIDQPSFVSAEASNPAALTAALTEPQLDAAYKAAMQATLNEALSCRSANFTLSARRSDFVIRDAKQNALDSFTGGIAARVFITGDPLGTTTATILANVALYRSDRVFYTGKGMKVQVSEIAVRGTAGGLGFTADGVITVRPDGPLAKLCCLLPPENNPGEQTGLIDDFFEVDTFGEVLAIGNYIAFKAGGVAVPRLDRQSGMVFQSGVTSSLTAGRLNMSRRKMADFLENTFSEFLPPFSKKLNKQERRDAVRSTIEQFLADLRAEDTPALQRIDSYSLDDGINAGNTAAKTALGIHYLKAKVRTLSTLDDIVMIVEAGESVTITEVEG